MLSNQPQGGFITRAPSNDALADNGRYDDGYFRNDSGYYRNNNGYYRRDNGFGFFFQRGWGRW